MSVAEIWMASLCTILCVCALCMAVVFMIDVWRDKK